MALLLLSSTNQNFSHVLMKNPQTQEESGEAFTRVLTDGRVSLWFDDPQKIYCLYEDFKNKSSNRKDILNFEQYTSGQYYLLMVETILRNAAFIPNELDVEAETKLEFNLFNYHKIPYDLIFPDYDISCATDIDSRNSAITIKTKTVLEALQLCTIICFDSIQTDTSLFINTSQYLKFAKYLAKYTTNYNVLKRFICFSESPKTQSEIVEYFKDSPFNIYPKKAQDIRKDFIVSHIQSSKVLDLGCGSGDHFKALLKNYDSLVGVEKDEDCALSAYHMTRKIAKEDSCQVYTLMIEDYLSTVENLRDVDVVCSEVLEHMPKEQAEAILHRLVELQPKQMTFTLPNIKFNQFYFDLFETGFRHDDHYWEPTFQEVIDFFKPLKNSYTVLVQPLGDHLKDDPECSTSIGIYLNRIDG